MKIKSKKFGAIAEGDFDGNVFRGRVIETVENGAFKLNEGLKISESNIDTNLNPNEDARWRMESGQKSKGKTNPLSFEGTSVKNQNGAIICEFLERPDYAGNAYSRLLKMVELFNDQHEIKNNRIEEKEVGAAKLHQQAIGRIEDAIELIKKVKDDSLEDDFHPMQNPEGDIIHAIAKFCNCFGWMPQDFANKYDDLMQSIAPGKEGYDETSL